MKDTDKLIDLLNEKYLGEEEQQDSRISPEQRKAFMEAVANYHRLGDEIRGMERIGEISEQVTGIIEQAEAVTIQESEHWFDNMTVSRHMKQLKESGKVFSKTISEMNQLQQRLEAAYDDIGGVLNKYYKIGEAMSMDGELTEDQYTAGVHDKGPAFDDHMVKKSGKPRDPSKVDLEANGQK